MIVSRYKRRRLFYAILLLESYYLLLITNLGGYSIGAPPLPIPNREVKPYSADGTA